MPSPRPPSVAAERPEPRRLDPEMLSPGRYPVLPFPDADWDWFVASCEGLEIPLVEDARQRLVAIYSHLAGVNEWMNLTRISGPRDYLKWHVLDSLTALDSVEEFSDPGDLCIDLGSGGGYPGLPLMTWLPDRRWALVDSRQKKVAFLNAAIPLTGCREAHAYAFRGNEAASACPALAGRARLVLARAVGPVEELMDEVFPLLEAGGVFVAMKGPAYTEEEQRAVALAAPNKGFDVTLEFESHLEPDDPPRFIILLTKTQLPRGAR